MNALFLKDLADKVRRGLRGRVEAGRSGGGNAYGYGLVRSFDAKGEPLRGERTIDAVEAADRARDFLALCRRRVAAQNRLWAQCARHRRPARRRLEREHAERQPRPRHRHPEQRELHRPAASGTGSRYVKDPETGKRRSRANASDAVVAVETPDLAIVPQRTLGRRQGAAGGAGPGRIKGGADERANTPFWSKQRPRYLFSGLMRCGVCGGGFSKISAGAFRLLDRPQQGRDGMRQPADDPPRCARGNRDRTACAIG